MSTLGVVRQAGHCDASSSVKGDVSTTVNVSPEPRLLLTWRVTHNDKCVGYYDALRQGGIKRKPCVPDSRYPELDDESQYEVDKENGWRVEHTEVELLFGEVLLWDGHLWHAGGPLVEGDEFNVAWWARLVEKKSVEGGVNVFAVNSLKVGK